MEKLNKKRFVSKHQNTNKTTHHANSTGNLRNTLVEPMWQGMAKRQDAKKLHPDPLSASSMQAQTKQASATQRDVHLRVLEPIKRHLEN